LREQNLGAIGIFEGAESIYAFKNAISEMKNSNLTKNYIAGFR
jgi:hypothetical protein